MTAAQFRKQVDDIAMRLRKIAPRKTDNLADNGITVAYVSPTEIRVYVDTSIAPYMVYTNEPWRSTNHGRWLDKSTGGVKKNPNEAWWNKFAEQTIPAILAENPNFIKVIKK